MPAGGTIHHISQTKSQRLQSELRATQIDQGSVSVLAHNQSLIDLLQATAETLSAKEYLDVILKGLPQD